MNMTDEMNNQFLSSENLRALAWKLLEEIPNGDINENVASVAQFIQNMVCGLLMGGAPSLEQAIEGLNAFHSDIKKILDENFDAAKASMATKN